LSPRHFIEQNHSNNVHVKHAGRRKKTIVVLLRAADSGKGKASLQSSLAVNLLRADAVEVNYNSIQVWPDVQVEITPQCCLFTKFEVFSFQSFHK
jgi:transcription elongation GreA/GreB family factor